MYHIVLYTLLLINIQCFDLNILREIKCLMFGCCDMIYYNESSQCTHCLWNAIFAYELFSSLHLKIISGYLLLWWWKYCFIKVRDKNIFAEPELTCKEVIHFVSAVLLCMCNHAVVCWCRSRLDNMWRSLRDNIPIKIHLPTILMLTFMWFFTC